MKGYIFVPLIGFAVLILLNRRILGRKVLLIFGGICFLAGVILLGYFFHQMDIFSQEECLFENGCMNEFGGFILFPISAFSLAAFLFLAAFIVPFRKRKNSKQGGNQVSATDEKFILDELEEKK